MNEYNFLSCVDENNMFHGGFSIDFLRKPNEMIGGGRKPSSSTLHHQELAIPAMMFHIPEVNMMGGSSGKKKYDEDLKDDVIDDELYEKLLGGMEVTSKSKKQTKKQKEPTNLPRKKTRKQKE